jgi:hypothetical protein
MKSVVTVEAMKEEEEETWRRRKWKWYRVLQTVQL